MSRADIALTISINVCALFVVFATFGFWLGLLVATLVYAATFGFVWAYRKYKAWKLVRDCQRHMSDWHAENIDKDIFGDLDYDQLLPKDDHDF